MSDKITEQKLRNKRFRKTEEAIILALLSTREKLSLRRLIKNAGISRSTLYRHHKNIYEVVPDYERYLIKKYQKFFNYTIKNKKIRLSDTYERTLIFLSAHQQIVEFIIQFDRQNIIENIIGILKPKILSSEKINDPTIFKIYSKEVSSIIEEWIFSGSQKEDISKTIEKISYLTDTAQIRLSPLSNL